MSIKSVITLAALFPKEVNTHITNFNFNKLFNEALYDECQEMSVSDVKQIMIKLNILKFKRVDFFVQYFNEKILDQGDFSLS